MREMTSHALRTTGTRNEPLTEDEREYVGSNLEQKIIDFIEILFFLS